MPDLLAELRKLPPKHRKEQAALQASYQAFYTQWHFQLICGFGLLMYGFGSKKALLENFASSVLTDGPAVVVNGYLPNVRIKQAIYTVAKALWERKRGSKAKKNATQPLSSHSLEHLLAFIQGKAKRAFIYVLVHNIDGIGVRDGDTQRTLAIVASCPCVRFVASIDNVNAPLLWDKQMANAKFNWLWHHTPTFAHYHSEATDLPLLLSSSGSLESARSAALVLKSLTQHAQGVYKIIVKFQLAHPDEQGLPFHRLYSSCRDQFLVTSELTLRAHLTEFKDHELVRWKRGQDGQDCLHVPLPEEVLTKLLQDVYES